MRQKRLPGVDMPRLREESGEVLSRDGNRLTLILAIMVAATPLMLYISVFSLFDLLFPQGGTFAFVTVNMIFIAISLFLTLPLWVGLLRIAYSMESGRDTSLVDVFYAFTHFDAYWDSYFVSCRVMWHLEVLVLAELFVDWAVWELSQFVPFLGFLVIPLYLFVFVLWFAWMMRNFLHSYLYLVLREKAPQMRVYAASACKHYWLGFFPWLVLSLLTFGILLLADTLPRMLIAYFRLCRKLNEFTTVSEDLIK